ncbi:MAG: right-handed parallel beta-helix repeat-containing protein [Planctomycetota bacterium]
MLRIPIRLVCVAATLVIAAAQSTHFVDASRTSGANDGTSWSDAFRGPLGLRSALQVAAAGDRVFIAGGVYTPALPGASRNSNFTVGVDLQIFGGFLGTESDPMQRPARGVVSTVLSADIEGDDSPGSAASRDDNSVSLVRIVFPVSSAVGSARVTLDGLTIRGGTGAVGIGPGSGAGLLLIGAEVLLRDCVIEDNVSLQNGGGLSMERSGLDAIDCVFRNNAAQASGGGLFALSSGNTQLELRRCRFTGNSAGFGGGLSITVPSPVFESCLFDGNVANARGGAATVCGSLRATGLTVVDNVSNVTQFAGLTRCAGSSSSLFVSNSVLWGNVGAGGFAGQAAQAENGFQVTRSIWQASSPGVGGNLNVAPVFVDAPAGDYRLTPGSPGIDAGDSGDFLYLWNRDLSGKARFVDDPATVDTGEGSGYEDAYPVVDMGAFELAGDTVGAPTCVSVANSGGRRAHLSGSGSSAALDDDLTLDVWNLPAGQTALLAGSRSSAFTPFPGGSSGVLCLGGEIGRYLGLLTAADSQGTARFDLDLTALVTPSGHVAAAPGDRWFFQVWYRDTSGGAASSNFTDALKIRFR